MLPSNILYILLAVSLTLVDAQHKKKKKEKAKPKPTYTAEEKSLNCVNQPKGTDYCGVSIRECVDGKDGDGEESLCPLADTQEAESEIICKKVPGKTSSVCFCPDKYRYEEDDGSSDNVCGDLKAKLKTLIKPKLLSKVEKNLKCVSQPKGTDYCGMSIDECVNGFEDIPGEDEILCPKARGDKQKLAELICKQVPGVEDEMACFCPNKYRGQGTDGVSDRVCEDLLASSGITTNTT